MIIPTTADDVKTVLLAIGGDYSRLSPEQREAILAIYPDAPIGPPTKREEEESPKEEKPLYKEFYSSLLNRLISGDLLLTDLGDNIRAYNDLPSGQERLDDGDLLRLQEEVYQDYTTRRDEDNAINIKILKGQTQQKNKVIETYFQNSPRRGIILLQVSTDTETGRVTQTWEGIFAYYISEIIRYDNPVDENEVKYSITFQSAHNRDEKLVFRERGLDEVVREIAETSPGVMNRSQLQAGISTIMYGFEIEKKTIPRQKLHATGFFLQKSGSIIWGEASRFRVRLPDEPDTEKIKSAFAVLDQVIRFYPGQEETFLTYLYYYIQAPLGLVRKQAGLENKMFLAYGIPHTGKTWIAKYGAALWGIPDEYGIIGAAALTPPQIADHLNLTTLPLCLDETRNMMRNPTIAELLKSASTNKRIKERIDPRMNYKKTTFYAYASLVCTSNFLPDLYTGLEERIIPVEFTIRHKNQNPEAVKDFERLLHKNREALAHIGAGLRWMFTTYSDPVFRLVTNNDQIKAGYEILLLLCMYLGISDPAWARPVEPVYEVERPNYARVLYDFLHVSYLDELRRHYRGLDIPVTWEERLMRLQQNNILPTHTRRIGDRFIVLHSGIIQEIAKTTGYEIPGGARGLSDMIVGADYSSYGGGRYLKIPITGFIQAVSPDPVDHIPDISVLVTS